MAGLSVQAQIALVSALVGLAVLFITLGLRFSRSQAEERLNRLFNSYERALRARDLELTQPFHERMLRPLFQAAIGMASRFAPTSNVVKLQKRLIMAGEPWGMSPLDFMGLRMLAASMMAVLTLIFTLQANVPASSMFAFTAAGGLFGFIYPNVWLNKRIKARQKAILKALPDALDMLTIAVNAGLGFDAALMRVVEKWSNPLTEEFQRVLYEMRMGVPRADALHHLAERTGVGEVASFVAIIVQAERLGASIADVLQAQAKALRERRRQWAEEQARKAPVKMLIPLILFVFPSLFVVILGPAVPRFMRSFGQ